MNLAKTINSMWIATKRKLNKRKIGKKREEKTYKHNLLRRKNKIFMTIANDFVGLNILSTLWSSHFTRWFFSRCVVELCRSLCRRVIRITFRDCSVLFSLNSGLWFVCWRLVSANVLCDFYECRDSVMSSFVSIQWNVFESSRGIYHKYHANNEWSTWDTHWMVEASTSNGNATLKLLLQFIHFSM